jgi:hypothetical protein
MFITNINMYTTTQQCTLCAVIDSRGRDRSSQHNCNTSTGNGYTIGDEPKTLFLPGNRKFLRGSRQSRPAVEPWLSELIQSRTRRLRSSSFESTSSWVRTNSFLPSTARRRYLSGSHVVDSETHTTAVSNTAGCASSCH